MINKVILVGNLGRDPEIRRFENGVVARFSVATNENYMDKSGQWQTLTEWHNVVMWRQLAERAERQLKKGTMVYLEGKLKTRKWKGQDDQDRYTTEIEANLFRVLSRREDQEVDSLQGSSAESLSGPVEPSAVNEPEGGADLDDLPF